jgi:hypothetical protein
MIIEPKKKRRKIAFVFIVLILRVIYICNGKITKNLISLQKHNRTMIDLLKARRPKSEDGRPKTEDGRRKTEDRRRKTEYGRG